MAHATTSKPDIGYLRTSTFLTSAKRRVSAVYEHPTVIRMTHWLAAISIAVLTMSGMQILHAFPSFGAKVPQHNFFDPPRTLRLGGWLAGALQWHFTFMWIFAGCGVVYVVYALASGNYRTVLFRMRDVKGVWPMVRHYAFRAAEPTPREPYNPLQKLAYSTAIALGAMSVLTGIVLYKPVQFHWLAWLLGGFHLARIWHFLAMCGFLAFLFGHVVMVVLHGWDNFASMLYGWKQEPPYKSASIGQKN